MRFFPLPNRTREPCAGNPATLSRGTGRKVPLRRQFPGQRRVHPEGGRHEGDGYRQASSAAWPPGVHERTALGYLCVAVMEQRDLERVLVASPRIAPGKEYPRVERTGRSAAPRAPNESETGTGEPSRSQSPSLLAHRSVTLRSAYSPTAYQ